MLNPYTQADFEQIAQKLRIDRVILDPVAAAESGLNFRAVEAALTNRAVHEILTGDF
ncbi:MAG: hypothetical protein NVV63_02470 [Opitutus sp.]|nr:hypothetical protein [Opitutus sp.]